MIESNDIPLGRCVRLLVGKTVCVTVPTSINEDDLHCSGHEHACDDRCDDKRAQLPFVRGSYNACGPAQRFLALMEGLSAQSTPDSRLFLFLGCSFYMAIPHQFGDLTRPSKIAFNDAGAGVLAPSAYTQSHKKSREAMIVGNLPLTRNLQR